MCEWSGVDGVDTPQTVMTTRAPAVLTNKQLKFIGGVPMICITELNSTFLETNDLQ